MSQRRWQVPERDRAWFDLLTLGFSDTELYERLKALSEEEIDQLLTLLTVLRIGQEDCEALDSDPQSLFNRLAADLGIEMREHWTPGEAFLGRRNREQLAEIARASGAKLTCSKKGELVRGLAAHFAEARAAAKPTRRQQQANGWLPGAMRFPAIDPAAEAEPEEEPLSAAA